MSSPSKFDGEQHTFFAERLLHRAYIARSYFHRNIMLDGEACEPILAASKRGTSAQWPTDLLMDIKLTKGEDLFNPFQSLFYEDPYPHYSVLRDRDPVFRSQFGVWFVARYTDVRFVLKNERFRTPDIPALLRRKNRLFGPSADSGNRDDGIDQLISSAEQWPAFLEGADHVRIRAGLRRALTRADVESFRPFVRSAAKELVEAALPSGGMDILADFGNHLPLVTLSQMLGIPREALPRIHNWTSRLARLLDSVMSMDELRALNDVSAQLTGYLKDHVSSQKKRCDLPFISALSGGFNGECSALSEQELVSTLAFIFVAGSDAVSYFLGNAILALIRHPDKLQYIRENLHVLSSAVDELLRFDAPLQMIVRTALEDVEIGGKTIRSGEQAYLVLGSANRDGERFKDPDELVLTRSHNHHMAFGDGHHMCVGAQLARLEAEEALHVLLDLVPCIRLKSPVVIWRRQLLSRGLTALPVAFAKAS